ncbi:hypothetical protein KKF84_03960, partial [Myxococcota bacterium]|nr:hypothetical protein [Myxococcota bacterium]
MATVNQMQAQLMALDKSIEKLRVLYEQFFMGIEKWEPATYRKQIKAELRAFHDDPPSNTAVKFLLNKVENKLKTYEQYWNRILREIENGVYEKQIKRMRRKIKDEGLPDDLLAGVRTKGELEAALAQLAVIREELEQSGDGHSSPEPAQSRQGHPPAIDPSIRSAYESFVRARLSTGESLEGVTPERFQATIASKLPTIKQQYNCEEVE